MAHFDKKAFLLVGHVLRFVLKEKTAMNTISRRFEKGCAVALSIGLTILSACTYDEVKTAPTCDITVATYAGTMRPLFDANCLSCHSTGNSQGGINLETYEGAKQVVTAGRLVGAVKHLNGFTPMPQFAPMLPECDIKKIEAWVDNGATNN